MTLIAEHIRARLSMKKNYMGIACGEPGSGKSYAVLYLASEVDPSFTVDRIAFTPERFIEIVSDKDLKSGSAIIFEEVGVGIPAREWYSISNKMVNYVFQTFRYKRFVCFFNTPSMSYIDSNTRVLFNGYIQPMHINFQREICTVKYFEMEHNPRDSQRRIYYHYLTNGTKQIRRIEIPKPHERLIEPYEEKKQEFAQGLATNALKELKDLRNGRVKEVREDNVKCECGYSWHHKGEGKYVQCPRCKRQFKKELS